MSPLPPTSGLRAVLAAWCVNLADLLTGGGMSRTLAEADRQAANAADLERGNQLLRSERQTALDAAEEAWAERDRVRSELSAARRDLAQTGRLLAARNLIPATGGPHLVREAVDRALGPAGDAPITTVADACAVAVRTWTTQPGKAGLLEDECTELGWVAAAALAPFLREDIPTVAPTAGHS